LPPYQTKNGKVAHESSHEKEKAKATGEGSGRAFTASQKRVWSGSAEPTREGSIRKRQKVRGSGGG